MSSRTNLKLQLQREQAQRDSRDESDRRGNGFSISSSTGSLSSSEGGNASSSTPQFSYMHQLQQQQHGSPIPLRNPNNSPANVSISATLPTPTGFQQYNLSVETRLENPTRFYVEEKQKQQMKSYLSNSLGRASPLISGHSLPSQLSLNNLRQHNGGNHHGASPLTPDSPMTPHSIGTPHSPAITDVSEMDELIEDIMELESTGTKGRRTRSPKEQLGRSYRDTVSPDLASVTGNQDYLRMLDPVTGKLVSPVSSSCPANLHGVKSESSITEEDGKYFSKDRQKKDNHNIIERKRRDNINNLIKELRTMLPHSSDPSKGSTLKATVDYLKELKKDRERLRAMEERQKNSDHQNRKLQMKVQELERLAEAHGIQLPMTNHDGSSMASMAPHLSALITGAGGVCNGSLGSNGKGSPQQSDSYPGTPTLQQQQQYQAQQYMQIKQEPPQSPIHQQQFSQYMNMNLPDDFPGVNFSVADLANMMDTAELDPMVSSMNNFDNYNVGDVQQLDMDFLT
ncbi:putative Transcription factor E3 [Hypsibius exemplaris]|uniref:Transcription factor E3 n=1 Tax=Hypsibius exemplaris TaxID=2072580 RepID=A0A1W0WUX6_HYPEX|nr:putative Transcription factor E3 [Hypsibius exemplaris]